MIIITQNRPARNQFEIDALPPFGKPEVIIVGEAAKTVGLIVGLAVALSYLR